METSRFRVVIVAAKLHYDRRIVTGLPKQRQTAVRACHELLRSLSTKLEQAHRNHRLERLIQTQDTPGNCCNPSANDWIYLLFELENRDFTVLSAMSQTAREFVKKPRVVVNFLKAGGLHRCSGHSQKLLQLISK